MVCARANERRVLSTDILSDVLRAARLKGAVFFYVEATSPWVAEAPPAVNLAPLVMPGAQHVIEYHVLTTGSCWARLVDDESEPIRMHAGSVVVFPQGDPHVMSSAPGMRAVPDLSGFDQPDRTPPFYIKQDGGGPERTTMICGFLGCDTLPFNPLLQSLPRVIHVPGAYNAADGWLGMLIETAARETHGKRAGSESVLANISELMFVEVVRRYMASIPGEGSGWLRALNDPHVGRAIRLFHQDPKRAWNLAGLSREIGVSRTVLVKRFRDYMGVAPMSYLQSWRMQLAAGMLAGGSEPIGRIAAEVGYESEAAFSRAFKRSTGAPPASWRSGGASRGGSATRGADEAASPGNEIPLAGR